MFHQHRLRDTPRDDIASHSTSPSDAKPTHDVLVAAWLPVVHKRPRTDQVILPDHMYNRHTTAGGLTPDRGGPPPQHVRDHQIWPFAVEEFTHLLAVAHTER